MGSVKVWREKGYTVFLFSTLKNENKKKKRLVEEECGVGHTHLQNRKERKEKEKKMGTKQNGEKIK